MSSFKIKLNEKFYLKDYETMIYDFYIDVLINTQKLLPQLHFREIFIGVIMTRSCLLHPNYPDPSTPIPKQLYLLGYNFVEGPKREISKNFLG